MKKYYARLLDRNCETATRRISLSHALIQARRCHANKDLFYKPPAKLYELLDVIHSICREVILYTDCLLLYVLLKPPLSLTQDVLVMLWDEGSPVLPVWFLDVDVDETVPGSIQVGAEREYSSLVGDV